MIIDLTKSHLFKTSPDIRFCKFYKLPYGIWIELWRRYTVLGYTCDELMEYLHIKTGRKIGREAMKRWLWRSEIYHMTELALKKGARYINSEVFETRESLVINELMKHMKTGVTKNTHTVL